MTFKDKVMFPFETVWYVGYYVGSFVDLEGNLRGVVQTDVKRIFSVSLNVIEIYNPESVKLKGCVLRETKLLPEFVSSKY